MAANQHVELLGSSLSPIRVMQTLAQREEPARKDELVTESLSYTTVQRVTEKLADREWITNAEGAHALTPAGSLVLQTYTEFVDAYSRNTLEFLFGSPRRVRVLRVLRDRNQSIAVSDLAEEISVPYSTVWRCLDAFGDLSEHDQQWMEQPNGHGYALTEAGKRVTEAYETLITALRWTTDHATIVNHLGFCRSSIPVAAFAGDDTTVVRRSSADREVVLNHYADRLTNPSPDRIRGISPIASTLLNDIHRPLLKDRIEIELLIDDAVLDVSRTSYPKALSEADQAETLQVYLCPDRLKYGLTISDFGEEKRVFLFAYEDQGILRACIDSAADAVIEWATALYENHREAAHPLETGELLSSP